jgi:hypothetical protein
MTDEFGSAGMASSGAEVMDFTNDGLPTGKDHTWTITEADEVEKENGKQWVFKFESETVPIPVTIREWLSHTNETAQRIGRGKIKQILTGVLGRPEGRGQADRGQGGFRPPVRLQAGAEGRGAGEHLSSVGAGDRAGNGLSRRQESKASAEMEVGWTFRTNVGHAAEPPRQLESGVGLSDA